MIVRIVAPVFAALSFGVQAQAPATPPPPVPADVSPLYVVTYVEVRPNAKGSRRKAWSSTRPTPAGSGGISARSTPRWKAIYGDKAWTLLESRVGKLV